MPQRKQLEKRPEQLNTQTLLLFICHSSFVNRTLKHV